jgi:hypothetical protein
VYSGCFAQAAVANPPRRTSGSRVARSIWPRRQARIIETQADHSRQLIQVRQDINNLRSDDLRRETMQAQMDLRLDRIETRLNLHDAQ